MKKDSPFVSLKKITKSYGNIIANQDISLDVYRGKIIAILGENGAGKSTLMKILSGNITPDSGKIFVDGKEVKITSPRRSAEFGIGMLHQHFKLIPAFTVMENIILGDRSYTFISKNKLATKIEQFSKEYGIDISPYEIVSNLSMGEKQRVELLKLLYKNANLLILDEPTTVLTPLETEKLFNSLYKIKKQNKAIIFISHKLEEVLKISDEIVILRKGKIIDKVFTKDVAHPEILAQKMVGKGVIFDIKKKSLEKKDVVLELNGVDGEQLQNVSLKVKKREIHAIVGVAGNGQRELIDIICGFKKPKQGTVKILGVAQEVFFKNNKKLNELSYIPEDRTNTACCMELTLWENFLLTTRNLFSKGPIIENQQAKKEATHSFEYYNVYPLNINLKAKQLSGGNLQKVVLAREMFKKPKLIIAEQPSQGLDIAATEDVWKYLLNARLNAGILLITGDLKEALTLADTISVIFKGKIVKTFDVKNQEEVENIGVYMAGMKSHSNQY